MEASKFNLGQSVNNHVSQIKQQGSLTDSDAQELTAHLYDATDDLKKHGLSEEEAFIVARKRIGSKEELTKECE